MEDRFGGCSTPVGREMDVDGCWVNACHEGRFFEKLSRASGSETGVSVFEVSTKWPTPPITAVTGKQDGPIGSTTITPATRWASSW